jgi:hypothetical protein
VAYGKSDGAFLAHCWLMKDGEPFLEAGAPPLVFTEMYRFASGPSAGTTTPGGSRPARLA